MKDGQDFIFIDEQGRGHVVGMSVLMESEVSGGYMNMNCLEGDERIHVDGSLSPCIYGTGAEDCFNAGRYFNQGTFNRPYQGHPWRDQFNVDAPNFTQAYRFHLSDIIPFNQSVRFGMEHGVNNAAPGTFASVTYYYKGAGSASGLQLVATLDVGDPASEAAFNYTPPAGALTVTHTWTYPGNDDDVEITDTGLSFIEGMAEFTVPVPQGAAGALLRRRTDQGVGGQKAEVYADGVLAGTWYEADHNYAAVKQRWLDSEFMIAPDLLADKTSVRIRIVPLPDSSAWNEYCYWVFMVPDDATRDRTIIASAGPGGILNPSGEVRVPHGGSIGFQAQADPHWVIDRLFHDGVPVPAAEGEAENLSSWTSVVASHTVSATFRALLTALGVPHWWLAEHELAEGGLSFDEAEMIDADGDGFKAWEEYFADTDPRDATSYLPALRLVMSGSQVRLHLERTSAHRLYHVYSRPDMRNPHWTPLAKIPGTGAAWMHEHATETEDHAFYRVRITLPEE